ncbi:MAG: ATP-dependent helicase, partial [Candidatus Fonsibacter sp.]
MKNGKPVNLYPLLFALNHPLAKDKWEYERRYCNACYKYVGNKSVWDNTGSSCLDELSIKTQDVILRRTKAQCLPELPIKTRLFIQCELEMAAAKDYQEKLL